MIRSMTGYGRGEATRDNKTISVEMRSVNHRYCEINVRMPRKLNSMENDIKSYTKNKLSRGKIDVFINFDDQSIKNENIKFNEPLAAEYMKYFAIIGEKFGLENDIKVSTISRYPDVLTLEEQEDDETILKELLMAALEKCVAQMVDTRSVEGDLLRKDIYDKLDEMKACVEEVKRFVPLIVEEYRLKLTQRIQELMGQVPVDENRLAMEITVYADKTCVDEEIVRLESHISHMKSTLKSGDSIGRKLDFLSQELNREANTILSKANNIDISNQGLELKTLIEKIREQIQNIE